jgi:hypothetical protein
MPRVIDHAREPLVNFESEASSEWSSLRPSQALYSRSGLVSENGHLPELELDDAACSPALGSASCGAKHGHDDDPIAESVGDGLQEPAPLEKEARDPALSCGSCGGGRPPPADGRCRTRTRP